MQNHQDKKKGLGLFFWILLGISGLLIIFSFFAPNMLVNNSLHFRDKGPIGDTIGGLMNPFIAIAGVIVTGLAFFIQYRANLIQLDINNKQLKKEKDDEKKEWYHLIKLLILDIDTVLKDINYKSEKLKEYFKLEKSNPLKTNL